MISQYITENPVIIDLLDYNDSNRVSFEVVTVYNCEQFKICMHKSFYLTNLYDCVQQQMDLRKNENSIKSPIYDLFLYNDNTANMTIIPRTTKTISNFVLENSDMFISIYNTDSTCDCYRIYVTDTIQSV
jgi:hypothetical protein